MQGTLDYLPRYLNGVNSTVPTFSAEPVTNLAIGTGSLLGLYWDLDESTANLYSNTTTGTCHEGRYRIVQVDSAATAANVKTGTIGFMNLARGVNVVTSADAAIVNGNGGSTIGSGVRPVVFLNSIAPGNYGVVQELGTATVLGKSGGLTAATPAVGDVIAVSTAADNGTVDDPTQTTPLTYALARYIIGQATNLPISSGLFTIVLNGVPVVQG